MTTTAQRPTATRTITPDQDLADYFQKCSIKELRNEAYLAQQTIRLRQSSLNQAADSSTRLMLIEDIRYAQERLDAITTELLRRNIP